MQNSMQDRAKLQRELAALRMAHGKAVERSNAAHAAARQERERCKAELAEARASHAREVASQQSKAAILQQVSVHFAHTLNCIPWENSILPSCSVFCRCMCSSMVLCSLEGEQVYGSPSLQ